MAEQFYHDLMEQVRKQFTEEELAGLTIDMQTVQKQNHQEMIGLTVKQIGSDVAPCIYMNEAKARYEHGESMDVLAAEIKRDYVESLDLLLPAKKMEMDLRDYDKVKDLITMRLLDIRRNESFLQDKPYLDVGNGLAIVCDIRLKQSNGDFYSVTINDRMLEVFGYNKNEIFQQSMSNAWENNTPRLFSMQERMFQGSGEIRSLLDDPHPIQPEEKETMYILSTDDMTMGAASLYVPQVQKQISQILGEGYYVLPSSIHEVLIVPESAGMEVQELCSMVREANRTIVEDKDVLSDFVYHYDQDAGTLQTVISTNQPYLLSLQDLSDASLWIENRMDYEQALKTSVLENLRHAMDGMCREGKTQAPFGKIISMAMKQASEDPKLQESTNYCLQNAPSLKPKIDAGQLVTIDQKEIGELQKIFQDEIGMPKERNVTHTKTAIRDRGEEIA